MYKLFLLLVTDGPSYSEVERNMVDEAYVNGEEPPPATAPGDVLDRFITHFHNGVYRKTSIMGNPDYQFGTYSPPFTANSGLWDGVRKLRYKTDLMVHIAWKENGKLFEHLHYTVAYIQPEALPFVQDFIETTMKDAGQRYNASFGYPVRHVSVLIMECTLGTARWHLSQDVEPHISVFFHQPGKVPAISSKNWPPEAGKTCDSAGADV